MGTWGPGSFDNDSAMDLLHEMETGQTTTLLRASISLPEGEYIDDEQGSRVIAMAELVAAANDSQLDSLPTPARRLLAKLPQPPTSDVVASTRIAIDRVMQSSETRELHAEMSAVELQSWITRLQRLADRLR